MRQEDTGGYLIYIAATWGPVKLGIRVLITPDGTPTFFRQSGLHQPFNRPPHIVQRMLQLKGKEIWEIRLSPNRESPNSGGGCLYGSSGVSRDQSMS